MKGMIIVFGYLPHMSVFPPTELFEREQKS